ncbi:2-hydroxyacyl-CoA dehydratase subunit D [Thermodesulfobacteriota bacterium]
MTGEGSPGNALERTKEIYQNRSKRARELKSDGQKIMGYFCCYLPLEILTAADIVPFRIMGNAKESPTVADTYLDVNFCPYVRSCFDIAMKGEYEFIDGIIWPTSCDNLMNLHGVWDYNMKLPFSYSLDIPRVPDDLALGFFTDELALLRKSVEEFTGSAITEERLGEAIGAHNKNRALLRDLYELRKPDPPLVSGSEVTQILVAVMSLPVVEANALLTDLIPELKERTDPPPKRPARLLMSGNELDDYTLIEMIEECGANVVIDNLCIGSRFFWKDVVPAEEPLKALARHYLTDILCSRTYRGQEGNTREEDLEARFGEIKELARDWGATGAVAYVLKYCDAEEWDIPDLRDYLQENGFPVLHLEHDYSTLALAPLKTRVQAFVEMIE